MENENKFTTHDFKSLEEDECCLTCEHNVYVTGGKKEKPTRIFGIKIGYGNKIGHWACDIHNMMLFDLTKKVLGKRAVSAQGHVCDKWENKKEDKFYIVENLGMPRAK